jgi:molybdopterin-guanine dinucleotide biosynthesis protein A
VLAGGRGERLGGAKATADLGGRPLIAHALDALRERVGEVVVVAKPGTTLPALDVPVWHDDDEAFHPRHGIVTALRGAAGAPVLALAVDLPYAGPALDALLRAGPTAVARADGRLQPLCALYGPGALAPLRAAPADEALTRSVLALDPVVVDVPAASLTNVNTPEDLRRLGRAAACREPPAS